MFVSSYNTYIQTDTSSKTQKQRVTKGEESSNFSLKSNFQDSSQTNKTTYLNLPIDYTLQSKSFGNKQKLKIQERNFQDKELTKSIELTRKFMSYEVVQNAKSAYESNSKLFSFLRKPQIALDQTPKTDKKLPKNIQELQKQNLRNVMVNTYIDNDKYYKITA